MPMMRRGPLDRYSAEWVLRQAEDHQASGSIEFHADTPLTVYLHGGRIHRAVLGIPGGPGARPMAAERVETGVERADRAATVEVLVRALEAQSGWYFHDPLAGQGEVGPWRWDVVALLVEARAHPSRPKYLAEPATLGAWETVDVSLSEVERADAVNLAPDAWAIVVALSTTVSAAELGRRLGWSPGRTASALEELRQAATLSSATTAAVRAPLEPAALPASPMGAATLTSSPSVPGLSPVARIDTEDRRSALRRLISTVRPA